jgi:beta-glucanase (GH16 family)
VLPGMARMAASRHKAARRHSHGILYARGAYGAATVAVTMLHVLFLTVLLDLPTVHAAPLPPLRPPSASSSSFCSGPGWQQVWADEFSETTLNTSNWALRTKGNVDRQAAVEADDIYLQDGALVLKTERRQSQGKNYTSGSVDTSGKRSWQGKTRVCFRAKLNGQQGVQPAHWLMPDNDACWPTNGEIDVMEMFVNEAPTSAWGTYIWKRPGTGCSRPDHAVGRSVDIGPDFGSEWHEYAVEYAPSYISFALDGRVYSNVTEFLIPKPEFFDVPYYAILDTSVGSTRAGPPNASTVFPTYHRIDYVRVAQPV